MIRSVKKIVSLIVAAGVVSSFTFTSLTTVEAKAATSISVNESGRYDNGALSILNNKDNTEETMATDYGLASNTKDGTILHCWSWSCNTIKENMKEIAEAGYSAIQTSPINNCKEGSTNLKLMGNDEVNGSDGAWWWYYQPTDWKIGNYVLGSEDDFKAMCAEAHKYGVKVIVDVVPNHTTGDGSKVSQNLINAAGGWDKLYHTYYNQGISNYNDRFECTLKGCSNGGLYDVNTENPAFQAYFVKYLNQCMADGADGFRYDTAKHIGLPSDPKDPKTTANGWNNNFWPVVTGKDSANGVTVNNNGGAFVYAEVLHDANVKEAEYSNYIKVTASNYGGKLEGAIGSKSFNAENLKRFDNPAGNNVVTWVESHDTYTGSTGNTCWMNDWQIRMCWAVIAARKEGTPLFFNRPDGSNASCGNKWGNNVMGAKGNDQFKDPEVVAVNKFRNAMVGEGEEFVNYGSEQVLGIERGNKGEVIINLGDSKDLNGCSTNLNDGTYYDAVTNNEFKVSNHKFTSGTAKGGKVTVLYDYKETKTPSVSADKNSQSFEGDYINVTLSARNCNSAYYTINGGAKHSYTDGTKITLGKDLKNGETVTLKLYGTGEEGSDTQEYVYKKIVKTYKENTLYANKVNGWGEMYAYIYKENGNTTDTVAKWPGVKMTYNSEQNRYEYELPDEYKSADTKVIFTDGSNQVPASRQPGKDVVVGKAMLFDGSEIVYKEPTTIEKELIAGATTTNVESPQILGTSIKITAGEANGGSGNYTYKITVDGKTIKDFSSSKTATWTPSESGNYNIEVTVKDSKGNEATDSIQYKINDPVHNGPSITAFTSSTSNCYVRTSITLSASAKSEGTVKYDFVVTLNGNEVYNSGYKTAKTAKFTPNEAGTYKVTCYAKDAYGKDEKTINIVVKQSKVTITGMKISNKTPQVGDDIKISAAATGKGRIKYRFVVFKDNTLSYVRGYSKKTNTIWTPQEAGKYTIYIKAKDSTGTETMKTINLEVKEQEGCKIESITTSVISSKSIRITASCNSENPVSYKIWVHNLEGEWTLLKNYSTKNNVVWKPTEKGNYVIMVQAKDSNGNTDVKTIEYTFK